MKKIVSSFINVLALLVFSCAIGDAASFTNFTGLSNPMTTINFDEFGIAVNTFITNQYADLGVTFTPSLVQDTGNGVYSSFMPNIDGSYLGNFLPCCANPWFMFFSRNQTDMAFAFVSNLGTSIFSAYLDGNLVESFSSATNTVNNENFYGFTGILFDQITVEAPQNGSMLIDNLQLNIQPVPDPSTIMLFGIGMVCMVFFVKRRQAIALRQ